MGRHVPVLCVIALTMWSACHDGTSPLASAGRGSATSSASTVSVSSDAGPVPLGVDDDGKTFDVSAGSVITFALASHAGTGYIWVPTQIDPNVLAQEGDRASESDSDVPGAPKRDIYRFTAKAAGTTLIEMSLKRPFGSAPAGRVVRVTFNIH